MEEQKELTLEEAKAKIAELEGKLNPPKPAPTAQEVAKQQAERKKQVAFFTELQRGAKFIKFILDDLHRAGTNRHMRRRFIRQLFDKKVDNELVNFYMAKIEDILVYLNEEVKKTTPQPVAEVDGADFLKHAREEVENPNSSPKV